MDQSCKSLLRGANAFLKYSILKLHSDRARLKFHPPVKTQRWPLPPTSLKGQPGVAKLYVLLYGAKGKPF
jgi:hypothetical protein